MAQSDTKRLASKRSVWQEIDIDILHQIFRLVDNDKDLFLGASAVCRWWRLACWDLWFWKDSETLDLNQMKPFIRHTYVFTDRSTLLRALKFVMNPLAAEERLRCLKYIVFPSFVRLENEHLILISQRSPNLRRLSLPTASAVTGEGLERAVANWRELEELSFSGPVLNHGMAKAIKTLGISCKNLTKLQLSAQLNRLYILYIMLDKRNSTAIAKNLQNLKVLWMSNAVLHKTGVWTIVNECNQLMEVHFDHCCRLEDTCEYPFDTVSVKIQKHRSENSVGWYVDPMHVLYSSEELINYLWP